MSGIHHLFEWKPVSDLQVHPWPSHLHGMGRTCRQMLSLHGMGEVFVHCLDLCISKDAQCYNHPLKMLIHRSFPRTTYDPLDFTLYSRPTEHQLSLLTLVTCLIIVLVGHSCIPVSPSALLFQTGTLSHYSSGNIHGPVSFYDILWSSLMTRPYP